MARGEITTHAVSVLGNTHTRGEDNFLDWRAADGGQASGIAAVLVVADGHGRAAAVATVDALLCAHAANLTFADADEMAVYLGEVMVHALSSESAAERPGITLTVAVIWRETLVLGHVGDSRCYLLRDGRAALLTEDSSVGAGQPDRRLETPLSEGDVLLLCSHGLSEHVEGEEMAAVFDERPLAEAVEWLEELALQRGGEDNVTLVAAQIGARLVRPAAAETVPPPFSPEQHGADAMDLPAASPAASPAAPAVRTVSRAEWVACVVLGVVVVCLACYVLRPAESPKAAAPGPSAEVATPVDVSFKVSGGSIVLMAKTDGLEVRPAPAYEGESSHLSWGVQYRLKPFEGTARQFELTDLGSSGAPQTGKISGVTQLTVSAGRHYELRINDLPVMTFTATASGG
jgi:protein phosphatase